MMRPSVMALSLAIPLLVGSPAEPQAARAGVVVESVGIGTFAETAGLRAGDVLVSWSLPNREGQGGPLTSPFDLSHVEIEVAPRGPVVLVGERAGQPLEIRVEGGEWLVRSRPVLGEGEGTAHRRAESLARGGRVDDALAVWRDLAEAAAARGEWALACWVMIRMVEQGPPGPAEVSEMEARAADLCASGGAAESVAPAHQALARAWQARYRYAEAEAVWRESLRLWEGMAPRSLGAASAWHGLGAMVFERGLPNEAEPHLRSALALREELAPDSLEVAATLATLGMVGRWQTRQDWVAQITRAAELRKRLAPGSLPAAESLLHLALAQSAQGDYPKFHTLAQEALSSASRIEPDGPLVGAIQIEMGNAAFSRGDLLIAEEHYRRTLAIAEKLAPQGRLIARALNNLGLIAGSRGDLEAAAASYRRALALFRLHWANALVTAGVLANYGDILAEQGRFADAERVYDEALAVGERASPGSNTFLFVLLNAAELSQRRGDQARFEAYATRIVELTEPVGRIGNAGPAYGVRAELAMSRGQLAEAEQWIREEIALTSRFYRAGALNAVAYRRLARLHKMRGDGAEAAEAYRRAVDALESTRGRLGGSGSARVGFGVRHAQLYHEAIEALLSVGRPAEAFHCLERSRARALLDMMSVRDLALDSELPPELRQRKRSLDAEYEGTQRELLDAQVEKRQDELADRLKLLDRQRKDVAKEARRISPRLATIADPQPLDVEQARATLDSETAFLAYSVGPQRTVLFVLAPRRAGEPAKDVEAIVIALGEAELRQRIAAWRRMVERTAPPPAFFTEGRALYDLLIRPAEPLVAPSRRLVISLDGPLHHLPFAALRRSGAYLAEWKPLSLVPSASVLEQLVVSRPPSPAVASLVAFGDPEAPGLPSLAGSRREVAALRDAFPRAQVFLGAAASKPQMEAVAGRFRYVHFAGHGLLEERLPLESALALSPGPAPDDDGRLRVWEVFERLRLDTDLLTLSACRSAAGTEAAGEGMLGLTRAFHYAGARSVMASLWRVPDRSTPQFMSWFYGSLKEGLAKDEALRRAQRAAIRAGHHPLRWASFQLYGDWR